MSAICPAGPPKLRKPILAHTGSASRNDRRGRAGFDVVSPVVSMAPRQDSRDGPGSGAVGAERVRLAAPEALVFLDPARDLTERRGTYAVDAAPPLASRL